MLLVKNDSMNLAEKKEFEEGGRHAAKEMIDRKI